MKASYRIIILLLIGSLLSGCTPNDNIDPDDPNVYSEQAYPGTTGEIVQLTVSGETITCEKINEEYIFQGDILLQPPTRGAVYAEGSRWPDNKVYYTINSNLPAPERVTQAIEYYHTTTNLTFIERTNQPNYIDFIYDANGCSSYLGMIGGIQPIRLADWGTKGNVIHEIGHAIGLLHEHSKIGRDQYVTINEENIQEGKQHNFTEYRSSNPNTDGFDIESIMLYSSYAFTKNGQPTIVNKNGQVFEVQRSQLSENDLEIIDQIYPGIPTVVTLSITDITENSAISGGNITADGGTAVTARGVCWSTSENPTTANSKTTDGTGVGDFTSNLTSLSPKTTYYVRAYATNSKGTAYGEQKTFTTGTEIVLPTVATGQVLNITTTTATCAGNVTGDGGAAVTARGVCWSTTQNPTTANSKTTDGTGLGTYTSNITGLSPNTSYYVRAYATNSEGTAYGEQKLFTTLSDTPIDYGSYTDSRDGKVYKTVTIGEQVWMAENLAYLPSVVGPATGSNEDPYYYVYDYNGTDVDVAKATTHYQTYGVLYNWTAAQTACPEGWHLPGDDEWTTLTGYLGGTSVAGSKMKEAGTSHWDSPNEGATNSSGFTALAGGNRQSSLFIFVGNLGTWWSSTEYGTTTAWYRGLNYNLSSVNRYYGSREYGYSVRCIQNNSLLTVATGQVLNITTTTATCAGNVTGDGGAAVTARGVCWSTTQNPTTANSKTTDGTGLGTYTSNITGLSPNTSYYVRAYATNSEGTAYGEQKLFTTLSDTPIDYGSYTDSRDGKVYKTVTIGEQVWMAENLAYLPSVVGPATGSNEDPYYYVYDYNGTDVDVAKATTHYQTYGVLYNWTAAQTACPEGWHLPGDDEWTTLTGYLGGTSVAGSKMKEAGTSHWDSPNEGATNSSGFTALAGGNRQSSLFIFVGNLGTWWSSTEYGTTTAWYRGLNYNLSSVNRYYGSREYGYSVRCIQDKD
jgi:uncharacterized protein (TIGR02145 family)